MAGISFGGVGSGLDIAGIVNQLVAAERSAPAQRINRVLARSNAQLSALGTFRASADALKKQAAALGASGLSQFSVTAQKDAPFTAVASGTPLTGQYAVTVQQQATAQTLRSTAFGSTDSTVGTGTLRITVGDTAFDIEVAEGDNALSAVANAINRAADNSGVNARVVNADDGAYLVLASRNSGSDNTITVEALNAAGGLDALAYSGVPGTGLTEIQPALDAQIEIDGLTITRGSNTFDDVIPGVSLTVTDQQPGEAFTVNVAADSDKTIAKLNALVAAYNATIGVATDLTRFDAASGKAGTLQGDATLRGATSQLRNALNTSQAENPLAVMSAIGFSTATDGKITLDAAKLRTALAENPNAVEQLLTGKGGFAERLTSVLDGYLGTDGRLDAKRQGLDANVKRAQADQANLDRRMDVVRTNLQRQFGALDTLVGQMSVTSSFLEGQLARLM